MLYLEDWNKKQYAIVDDKTPRKSWVVMAAKYKQMGVKNYYFHLALHNPLLQGVDPYSEFLTDDQKQMILLECSENYWYALREVIRFPQDGSDDYFHLDANRGNLAMFWCVFNSFITYVQQIRQTGKSLNSRALIVLLHMFAGYGSTSILFTKGDLRKSEIKNYKAYRDALPKWMWYKDQGDTDNQYEFTTMMNKNITNSYVPQGSPEDANNVGRGKTPRFIYGDEIPFLAYVWISIPALIASTTDSFDKARARGEFYGILYTTTAGDLSTESGKYVYNKIKKQGMFFGEHLFDAINRSGAVDLIMANSKCESREAPFVDISFNHLQLGKSNEWLRGKIAIVTASRDQIERDFLGRWTYGSESNPIPEKILNKIRDNTNPAQYTHTDEKYKYTLKFQLPIEEVKKRKSIMGLDTSNAINRDAISGVMLDVETGETLMTFSVSEVSLSYFAYWLAQFMADFPNMTLIPENKSSWLGMCDILNSRLPQLGVDIGRRIYSSIVDTAYGSDAEKRTYRDYCAGAAGERKYFPYRNDFGFMTTGGSRADLYFDVLKVATVQQAELIRDPTLIDELSSLVERRGRIDHKASGHDDHVIAWLMANWFLRHAWNTDHYGIDQKKVLSKVRSSTIGSDPKMLALNNKIEKQQVELELLEARIEGAATIIERRYLEAKLKSMLSEVAVSEESDVISVDRVSVTEKKIATDTRQSYGRDGLFAASRNMPMRPSLFRR
jgi:hypothetical protein